MYNVVTNYQLNFKALVPKAKYSGKPRFPEPVINEYNRLKGKLTEVDKEILDLENDLRNPDNQGDIIIYLNKRLDVFNSYREKLEACIAEIKAYGRFFDLKSNYKIDKTQAEELQALDNEFAKAARNGYWA